MKAEKTAPSPGPNTTTQNSTAPSPSPTAPPSSPNAPPRPSPLRRLYLARLAGRALVLLACFVLAWRDRDAFRVLYGWNFFASLSPLHLLWGVWIADMAAQLVPVRVRIALGAQKLFRFRFRPVENGAAGSGGDMSELRRYTRRADAAALLALFLWVSLLAGIWTLYALRVLDGTGLFLVSVSFYVCDLICVLIWCPFRLLLGNRCCTTCRIFNWDHMMMFTPLLPVRGFYTGSLLAVSLLVFGVWEAAVRLHPERFWAGSNAALRCGNCTDKLCTQYCQRRRRRKAGKRV